MQAILLAGGKGTRMESDLPKALILARGKPILSHQLDFLLPRVDKIVLALGYQSHEIMEFVQKNYTNKPIIFSVEQEPLGTGGALNQALKLVDSEDVLVLNADDLTDIDPKILKKYDEHVICVAHPLLPFGRVLEHDGYAKFEEKPILQDWVSCGWYLFKKSKIQDILKEKCSLEYDIFPKIKLRVHKHEGFWHTLNSKKDLDLFEESKKLPEHIT